MCGPRPCPARLASPRRCHSGQGATMAAILHLAIKHQRRPKRNDAFTQMRQSTRCPVSHAWPTVQCLVGPAAASVTSCVESSSRHMPKLVLIVDDDPAQRRILEETIRRLGFETRTAQGGEQALQILEGPDHGAVALVLLDLVMPGMHGTEVLKRLASKPGIPPIIVQTAHGS